MPAIERKTTPRALIGYHAREKVVLGIMTCMETTIVITKGIATTYALIRYHAWPVVVLGVATGAIDITKSVATTCALVGWHKIVFCVLSSMQATEMTHVADSSLPGLTAPPQRRLVLVCNWRGFSKTNHHAWMEGAPRRHGRRCRDWMKQSSFVNVIWQLGNERNYTEHY